MNNSRKSLKKVFEHQLLDQVTLDAVLATKDLYEPNQLLKVSPKLKRKLTEYEFYLSNCGYTIAQFATICNQIVMIPAYIKEYYRTKAMRSYGVTRLHDIAYHYENFIIRTKSLDDRVLQLCNAIFHLGINKKDVNFNLIINNSHILSSSILTQIKDIHNFCDQYGNQRNQIIHQHSILDEDLRRIELMLNTSRRGEPDLKIFAQSQYRRLIKEYVNENLPQLDDFLSKLLIKIYKLFDSLEIIYQMKKKELKN